MRSIIAGVANALIIAGLIAPLSSCANLTNSASIAQEIQDVQTVAAQVCSVIPAASAVSAIILAGSPALATAQAIATAICAAVAASGQAPVASKMHRAKVGAVPVRAIWTPKTVTVNGVPVTFE